jgi:hypothetical protein
MILLRNHDYIVSQTMDYRLDMFVTSKQTFVDLMTQHMTNFFCNVDNTKSLELEVLLEEPNAIFVELLGQ